MTIQAASPQEVEDTKEGSGARPLTRAPEQASGEFTRIRYDTYIGMAADPASAGSASMPVPMMPAANTAKALLGGCPGRC